MHIRVPDWVRSGSVEQSAAVLMHGRCTPESGPCAGRRGNMLDWLTWPADQLLRIGGVVAGWFFSKDATSFTVLQMMVATLVLAAFVALLVFWQSLFEYCRSLWKTR